MAGTWKSRHLQENRAGPARAGSRWRRRTLCFRIAMNLEPTNHGKTMKYVLLTGVCLGFLSGCGKGPGPNADIDQAGPALRTALEAWKDGKPQTDFAGQNSSILMNEDDWREGKRLTDYKMDDAGALQGRQVVWWVEITLEDKDGKAVTSKAKYVVDTTPRLVIVRDRFASFGK